MGEREVTALLALLGLLAAADGNEDQGFVSRLASRATGAVVDVVDPEAIVERIDVDALMERVDMDALLARVDINALMARVDMNALIERVDVNALIERVDVNALMARIDVEAIVDRVDVKDVMDRAGIPDVVRESTGALAGSALDVARRTIVALDKISGQVAYRLTGRDPGERPPGSAGSREGRHSEREGEGPGHRPLRRGGFPTGGFRGRSGRHLGGVRPDRRQPTLRSRFVPGERFQIHGGMAMDWRRRPAGVGIPLPVAHCGAGGTHLGDDLAGPAGGEPRGLAVIGQEALW